MNNKIKLGIVGYGNLGRGVELAVRHHFDMELSAIFTRRNPDSIKPIGDAKVLHINDAIDYRDKIDAMILCGGSADDLPEQGPYFAKLFNTVDSFDTHAKIPEYFDSVDIAAKAGGNVSAISIGWDPGLFSINRMLGEAILPQGKGYTFWGKGISQGHSSAIRGIKGVKSAVQYTIPMEQALDKIRTGELPDLTTREKHLRDCYVVLEEGADQVQIEHEIKTMPNYFADYETRVTFISLEELRAHHGGMPHGGFVIHGAKTGEKDENNQRIEFSLKLDSNPEFTSSILIAYARAVYRLNKEGHIGARTILDIPLGYLSSKSPPELRATLI